MVAATNTSANNVMMKALSATPATPVNGKAAGNGAADANASGADSDFTTLLNSLLGDNTDAATVNTSQKPATATDEKEDSKTDSSIDMSQWLLSPLTQSNTQPLVAQTTAQEDGVDTIDALNSGNNAAANALLAQSLKRFAKEKDSTGNTEQVSDSAAALAAKGSANQSALNDLMGQSENALQANPMLTDIDTEKKGARPSGDAGQEGSAATPIGTFQASINDINNAAPKYEIHSHVGTREWTNDVGNQLTMMVSHKIQSASLQLNPDNLGPVQVKIDVTNNQATVWFTADHPDTRTALEQSLPQLRELFASQGMSLMDAGVSSQQSQQQTSLFNSNSQSSLGMTDMSNEATMTQQVVKIGLLDTYA